MQTINSNKSFKRQTYIIVSCVILISLVVGSFSYSSFSTIGDASNNVIVEKFPLTATYKGTDYITGELHNLSDEWGIELEGNSFSILNDSDNPVSYTVLIESLNDTLLEDIKINIDDSKAKTLSDLPKKDGKAVLFEGVLKEKNDVGDVITHIVRTWSNKDGVNVNLHLSVISDTATLATKEITDKMEEDDSLIKDPFGNVRYTSKNPANYIKYNDELWRIVGIFNVVRTNDREEYRLKLVRDESITTSPFRITDNFEWNSNLGKVLYNYVYGENNELYKLQKESLNYIDFAYFNLGGLKDPSSYEASDYYDNEISATDNFCRNEKERFISGLLSICDYYYASLNNKETNWLNNGTDYYLINNNSLDINESFYVSKDGDVKTSSSLEKHNIRPVVYLKSTVVFNGGTGLINDPYILK